MINATSHADPPPTILVTCGYDMLRDVGPKCARKFAVAGNEIACVHHADLPHGFILMTRHSKRYLAATEERARPLGAPPAGKRA